MGYTKIVLVFQCSHTFPEGTEYWWISYFGSVIDISCILHQQNSVKEYKTNKPNKKGCNTMISTQFKRERIR